MRHASLIALLAMASTHAGAQTVRDSAGVRVVAYARSAQPGATWRLSAAPILAIGGGDATGPAMFAHIWGASRTPSGGVVVSDEPAQELRVFDAQGRHVRTIGRKGQGPGEFTQIRGVAVYGDTMYATDDINGTAVFTLDGKVVRQHKYPSLSPYHAVDPWGVLPDGSVIEGAAAHNREDMTKVGSRIETRGLFRIAADGRSAALLTTFPAYEFYRKEGDPPGGDIMAFSPYSSVAVAGDRICVARPVRYEFRCLDANGKTYVAVQRDVAPVPVTQALKDAYLKKVRTPVRRPGPEGTPPPQARLDAIAARANFVQTLPAFEYMIGSRTGDVWVSEFDPASRTRVYGEQPPASATTQWNVFARDGGWIARIALPARLSPRDIGNDYVLGVTRDDDGVEGVAMYRIIR